MPLPIITFFSIIAPDEVVSNISEKIAIDGVQLYSAKEYTSRFSSDRSYGKRLYLFIGTGGTEQNVKDFLEEISPPESIILFSHPSNNSLPASMEIRAYLQKEELEGEIVHGTLEELVEQLEVWVDFTEIVSRIKESKMLVVGEPSSWLIASEVEHRTVEKNWGMKIIPFDLEVISQSLYDESSKDSLDIFLNNAEQVEVSRQSVNQSIRVLNGLENILSLEKIDALTIQCFSLFEGTGVTACNALSVLNEREDLVAGCEGDIPSTFTMFIVKLLTGNPSFMANVIAVDEEENTTTFAHCTLPRSMVESHDLVTHFETDSSVAIRGRFKPQEVTIVKVGGFDLTDYWVSKGTIIDNQENEDGCRTQIRIKMHQPIEYFLKQSIANHHIIVLGDYEHRFRSFFKFTLGKDAIA